MLYEDASNFVSIVFLAVRVGYHTISNTRAQRIREVRQHFGAIYTPHDETFKNFN